MPPTKSSTIARIKEYDQIGKSNFLRKYASGIGAKSHYVLYKTKLYDLKALYGASCVPPAPPSNKTTRDSRKVFEALGFKCVSDEGEDEREFVEGRRRYSEVQLIARNKGLVAKAKEFYKTVCRACGFDFASFYGEISVGFIECHHLTPVAKGGDGPKTITISEVTVLCSNCHRMVHTSDPPLSVEQLKALIEMAQDSN